LRVEREKRLRFAVDLASDRSMAARNEGGRTMRFAALVLLIVSIAGLIGAMFTGAPTPSNPRHGTFGVDGLDPRFIAWGCVVLCVIGLILLFIDSKRPKPPPREPGERDHTGADDLFGEHDVERDLQRRGA
jgi:hypothetical protein